MDRGVSIRVNSTHPGEQGLEMSKGPLLPLNEHTDTGTRGLGARLAFQSPQRCPSSHCPRTPSPAGSLQQLDKSSLFIFNLIFREEGRDIGKHQ